ncbi:hypothetical protein OROGR_019651 [Orobanche gracilis]
MDYLLAVNGMPNSAANSFTYFYSVSLASCAGPPAKRKQHALSVKRDLSSSIFTVPLMEGIHDYMFEESLCLLLRASWYKPLVEVEKEELDKIEDYCYYDNEEEDLAESYFCSSSSPRIGNRRWGDNGYVRAGRQEARPTYRLCGQDSDAGSSRQPKKETLSKEVVGRRAKRASKREAADKAAAGRK